MKTFTIEYRDGWSANNHFGREIFRRLCVDGAPIEFPSLKAARAALNEARTSHGGKQPGRFDVVSSTGERWSWQ